MSWLFPDSLVRCAMMIGLLLRLVYLGVTNVFALLRLFGMSEQDKDVEILALRHQVTVLQRQLGTARPRFTPCDRVGLGCSILPRHPARAEIIVG